MKKFIPLLSLILLTVAGCSSVKNTAVSEQSGDSVNVGYGNVDKDELTYSVGHVKNKKTRVYNSIYDYLRDMVPGVKVEYSNSGAPKVYVRGISTVFGPTDPLFLVDGVTVNDISFINPYEVDSVDVLKDASAAIYGVQGANGVILINLKKGDK